MELRAIIGLEIHVEMNTKSKMFSNAPVSFGQLPNTQVGLFDMAFPGTMPTVNKQAVINAIRVSNALNMTIDNVLLFDRKNYFYSDLPKGYQITQYFRPIGREGYLTFKNGEKDTKINIERLHLEEDTCKQFHVDDFSYLDYNRAGIPIIEIVTKPEFSSGKEVRNFVEAIRSIVVFLGVSNGKMEDGNIRVDLNVSIEDSNKNWGKVEIKNLNSLSNIEKAINYEVNRQKDLVLKGKSIEKETRRYDEINDRTVKLRVKVDSVDYRYFTDPNIPPIKLSDEFIKEAIETSPELASSKQERYKSLGLSDYEANLITNSKESCDYFEKGLETGCSPKTLANWINIQVQKVLKLRDISINEFSIAAQELGELVLLVEEHKINNSQAKSIFNEAVETGIKIIDIINKRELNQIVDENEIIDLINEIINSNQNLVNDYKNGKEKVVGYIVGLVMSKTQRKADPSLTNKLTIEELRRR